MQLDCQFPVSYCCGLSDDDGFRSGVETSVNTNNSPSQDYTTNPDDHSNHNIDSPGFKPFTVILCHIVERL